MRNAKRVFAAILLMSILSMVCVTTFASSEKMEPRYSNFDNCVLLFSATESGGYIDVTYNGYDSFLRADLTVKLEKRTLLFFWNEIDAWNVSSTQSNGHLSHVFSLNGSGKYRATFTLLITGSDGSVDSVQETIESKY